MKKSYTTPALLNLQYVQDEMVALDANITSANGNGFEDWGDETLD